MRKIDAAVRSRVLACITAALRSTRFAEAGVHFLISVRQHGATFVHPKTVEMRSNADSTFAELHKDFHQKLHQNAC